MRSRASSTGRSRDRGQTSLDFLIGVGIFMISLGFVITVVPGMISPFSDAQENPLVTDRVTSEIAEGMLTERGEPSVLNETCTYAFFNESLGDGSGCVISFDETESDLRDRLGIDDEYRINVSIKRNVTGDPDPDILCTDGDTVGACSGYAPADRTRLAIGREPSRLRSVVSTRRTAFLDDKDVLVVVKVW